MLLQMTKKETTCYKPAILDGSYNPHAGPKANQGELAKCASGKGY